MKEKIIYLLGLVWNCFTAFSFPICLALIFTSVTGNSKGYDYDLGAEREVSVLVGLVMLIIWLFLAVPSGVYVFRKTAEKSSYLLIPLMSVYLLLAVICVFMVAGSFSEYLRAFGI